MDSDDNQIDRKSVEKNKALHGIELIFHDVESNNRLSVPNLTQCNQRNDIALKIMKNERSQSLDPTVKLNRFDSLKDRIISLGELSADVAVCAETERKGGKWYEAQT